MKLVIINPNSDPVQTQFMDQAARAYANGAYEVCTRATPGAPCSIDTYQDAAQALPGMMALVRQLEGEADGFIIACHGDPNLDVMKEMTRKPVVGIGEASMKVASMLGHRFSVVSTGDRGIPNKEANIHRYGLEGSLASLRCPGPDCDAQDMEGKLRDGALHAIQEDGAEAIVLCAAGQIQLARAMTQELGVPVLDGLPCALTLMEGLCKMGVSVSNLRRYRC